MMSKKKITPELIEEMSKDLSLLRYIADYPNYRIDTSKLPKLDNAKIRFQRMLKKMVNR